MTITNKDFKNLIGTGAHAAPVVEPRCPHARECGGCAFQDHTYDGQVAAKAAALRRIWQEVEQRTENREQPSEARGQDSPYSILHTPLSVVPSPDPYDYRTRMDYVATKGRFGLRMRGRFNHIIDLQTCHLIPPPAFEVAYLLWQRSQALELPDYNLRLHEGFLRYIVVRRSPQNTWLLAMVTASDGYGEAMEQLAELALAQSGVIGFHWLLNNTRTDLSFGTPLRHWGAATLPMQVGDLTLHIGPNTFFQNNVHLLLPLLDAVRTAITNPMNGQNAPTGRVADLYGGVGTIALHLAPYADTIVTVESHAESAALARYNASLNKASNVRARAADVAAFLYEQAAGSFDSIIADPPRTGLGIEVCTELLRLRPRRIVYVSCNPLTQREDIQHLASAYRMTRLQGYDMFPHTPHLESLAVLDLQ